VTYIFCGIIKFIIKLSIPNPNDIAIIISQWIKRSIGTASSKRKTITNMSINVTMNPPTKLIVSFSSKRYPAMRKEKIRNSDYFAIVRKSGKTESPQNLSQLKDQ
jgi:hypothetical protein